MHISPDVKGFLADAGHGRCGHRNTARLSAQGFFTVQHTSPVGHVFISAGATTSSPQPTPALLPRVWRRGQHGTPPQVFAPRFVPLLGAVWALTGFSCPSASFSQHGPTGQTSSRMTGAASTLLGFPHLIAPTFFSPASCPATPGLSIRFVLISPSS